MKNVLVVCIGNICRSPIGELLLKMKLAEAFPDVQVSSAGLGALVSYPADPSAHALMAERGFDLSAHRARQLNSEILFSADLVLTMTQDQQEQIETRYPSMRGRVHRLGKWSGFDVPDPYKRPRAVFEQALALIDLGLAEWCSKLWPTVR